MGKRTYNGGCQCGDVRYTVDLDIKEVMACNCSRCGRLGTLLAFAPVQKFRLDSGDGRMTEYQFNKHNIHHMFCSTCGIQSFSRGKAPDGAEMVAINVRCLDGVDPNVFPVKHIDGKSF
jgi:hypothetical protein